MGDGVRVKLLSGLVALLKPVEEETRGEVVLSASEEQKLFLTFILI